MKNTIFALFFVVSVALAGYGSFFNSSNAQSGLVVFEGDGQVFSVTSGHLQSKEGDLCKSDLL